MLIRKIYINFLIFFWKKKSQVSNVKRLAEMTFKSNTSQVTLKAYIAILHCFITGFSLVKKTLLFGKSLVISLVNYSFV